MCEVLNYIINGGQRLSGDITVSGSKNAVLPILAATIVTKKKSVIHNCPRLSDVASTIRILQYIGCDVLYDNGTLAVNAENAVGKPVPKELMSTLRSSVIFLGAFLALCGEADISYPGGCELGKRPIDIHIDILRQMGVLIADEGGYIKSKADKIRGGRYALPFPSIGATENILLASLKADSSVTIENAANEPEIKELANFLNRAGAKILGAGTSVITVEPASEFTDCEYTVCSDRIEAATFMSCAAVTGSTINIKKAPVNDIKSIINAFEKMGCRILNRNNEITIISPRVLNPVDMISTSPYPGFPTDAQPVVMAAMLNSKGVSMVVENIFEKRFNHIDELRKLGAQINVFGNTVKIRGSLKQMHGGTVIAHDLRAGAAMIVAALGIEDKTVVSDSHHIIRGYENIAEKLRNIGADIRVEG